MTQQEMINYAVQAMKKSYAPYSDFNVGACLKAKSGNIYLGCNIENAAFSPSICAERTAFAKAVSEGEREFEGIAIVGGKNGIIEDFCPPCGVCRQVMAEFCGADFEIILFDGENVKALRLNDILPYGFGKDNI